MLFGTRLEPENNRVVLAWVNQGSVGQEFTWDDIHDIQNSIEDAIAKMHALDLSRVAQESKVLDLFRRALLEKLDMFNVQKLEGREEEPEYHYLKGYCEGIGSLHYLMSELERPGCYHREEC